jgi:hypothetical protein
MNVSSTRLSAIVLVLASAIPFSGGCTHKTGGSDAETQCVTACTAANACPDATQNDCPTLCNEYDSAATSAGCASQYDAFMSCLAGLPSQCTTSTCDGQLNALMTCIGPYCTNNPDSPVCK